MNDKIQIWLDKRVRPITLFYLLFMLGISSILDASFDWFNMPEAYIVVYGSLLGLAVTFYFTAKTVERVNRSDPNISSYVNKIHKKKVVKDIKNGN